MAASVLGTAGGALVRRTRFVAAALAIAAAGAAQAQGIPVFDSSSFGQMVLTVKTLGD